MLNPNNDVDGMFLDFPDTLKTSKGLEVSAMVFSAQSQASNFEAGYSLCHKWAVIKTNDSKHFEEGEEIEVNSKLLMVAGSFKHQGTGLTTLELLDEN